MRVKHNDNKLSGVAEGITHLDFGDEDSLTIIEDVDIREKIFVLPVICCDCGLSHNLEITSSKDSQVLKVTYKENNKLTDYVREKTKTKEIFDSLCCIVHNGLKNLYLNNE